MSRILVFICTIAAVVSVALPAAAKPAPVPGHYRIDFATSRGDVVVAITRAQAPHGADRLYELVRNHVFDGARFYRVVPGFVVQWGYAAQPAVSSKWSTTIPDDPVRASNARGTIAFAATSEPNSRSMELFINSGNNARLDALGFAPLGRVVSGMNVVDTLFSSYGEQPDQAQIAASGNTYLAKAFPKLDYIKTARIAR